ncbi:hypothetical protein AB0M54_16460 [Actinoplanes sp. NPDC051470]|uniref:hypothetical protein n=1 Tax=Actinoplanes sp. NPDC051470 TaxID=3157224 RepID=UPI0034196E29
MERSPADEAMASDVAVADLPFSSGAHWANRDSLRNTGEQAMFRRPPAASSFSSSEDPYRTSSAEDPYRPSSPEAAGSAEQPWDAFGTDTGSHAAVSDAAVSDTGSRSRASFGMTDEPISGNWFGRDPSPVSPAAPAPAFPAPVQPEPIAVELPVRLPEPTTHTGNHRQTQMPLPPQASPRPTYQVADYAAAAEAGAGFFNEAQQHEIRPHRAAPAGHHQQGPPRRSKGLAVATVTLSALVLLGGVAAGVRYFTGDDKSLGSVLQLGNEVSDKPDSSVATAPLGRRTSATFELVAATRKATVKTQDLGDELYRISALGQTGAAPRPAIVGDKVQLLLETQGAAAPGNVEILLSNKVTWGLLFTGGADEQLVDLTGGKLSAIDLTGASRRVNLTLPPPQGTVQVRITGAIEDLSLSSGSPVRVRVDGGVKTVAAGERTLKNLEPGSTLTPKDWKAANRYDVSAESRLTLLTVKDAA